MGGPKTWRERQKEQQAFLTEYNQEEPANFDDNDDCGEDQRGDPDEKRDLYAEYDIDPETEIEKDARGGNDPGADDGPEDVNFLDPTAQLMY
jgi:Swi5-dependent recombination DNA repair protein 1